MQNGTIRIAFNLLKLLFQVILNEREITLKPIHKDSSIRSKLKVVTLVTLLSSNGELYFD